MGYDSSFVYIFSEFSVFAFSALSRTFISKEPPETLDSSTTVNLLVSVHISNLLSIIGLFKRFCGWGSPIRFCKGFRLAFS